MIKLIYDSLVSQGVNPATAGALARVILAFLAIVLSIVANFVAKRLILKGLTHIIVRTETKWDDIFLERKVFGKLSHLVPATVLYVMAPLALEGYDLLIAFATNAVFIYMIIVGILVVDSFLNAVLDIYRTLEVS